jgi:hypothetical protein
MKKLIYSLILLLAMVGSSKAQRPGGGPGHHPMDDRREEIEAYRTAYFTRQIGLTTKEAERFWPVYNEMQNEIQKLQKERRMRQRGFGEELEGMKDAEIEKLINEEFISRQKELDIEKKYNEQFKSILGLKKLALYYRAQEGFKRELVRKMQEFRRE